MVLTIFLGCVLSFLFSAFMTWRVRLYVIHKAILDIPNERSSHHSPTPRGGGIAIVFTFLLTISGLGLRGMIDANLVWALLGGGIIIATVSYCDDVYSIKARWRILLHFSAAIWTLYWFNGFPVLDLGTVTISLHWLGSLIAMIGIVWCTNFYNFMDGIDGLAGAQGIFLGMASGIALWFIGSTHLALVMLMLASMIGGFTIWNWPPAKIFLGDVGSGFLGFVFATLGVYTANKELLPITFWWLIFAIFICDATFTLLSRAIQGKKWYNAHREHAYQQLIKYGASHRQVTVGVLIVNCCILMPIAYATLYWHNQSLWIVAVSTLSLWLGWVWIKFRRESLG